MSESIFFLSPANLNGKRGKMLLNPDARFALAQALRSREGAALGDVYAFVSGLYFRGKAAYATKFARSTTAPGVWVMTPGGGLCGLDERVTTTRLAGWQRVRVAEDNPHFTAPVVRQTSELLDKVRAETRFILLGSIASRKYVGPLFEVLGSRLFYPARFKGLGDMSRGALLLRCVREETELEYAAYQAD
ncbi:MAG: hypothetical protein ABUL60_04835 [Myxococcales bacterium]